MDLPLTNVQVRALRRAVLGGDYHLLLGAGANLESIDTNGRALPVSGELAKAIAENFGVPIEDDDLLWRIYARAVEKAGENTVYHWLRKQFWGVKPPQWMELLAQSPWSTVWTLNIDDTFEQAYGRITTDASRKLSIKSWNDDYIQNRELSAIHLHGCVDRDLPRSLVFSLSEYAHSAAAAAAWPLNFRDVYGVSPFVIIGARLRDEPDIEAVVSSRKPTHEAPSIYVNPNISDAAEYDMRSWNLVPVRMTGEQFVTAWSELTGLKLGEPPTRREELGIRLGRQFVELQNSPERRPKSHDFIGGDEPRWGDIQNNLYAELDWIRNLLSDCRTLGKHGVPTASAIVYAGPRLAGRSTGLLVAGREMRARAWRTFLFKGDGRIDIDAVLGFAADQKSVALLFDSVADFAEDIRTLLDRARGSGLNISCVAVDSIEKTANIISRLDEGYLIHRRVASVNSRLTRTDAARLVDKLQSIARLGVIEPKSDQQRLGHFRNREIFSAMAELENAQGFGRRINELVTSIESTRDLQMLLIVAVASRVSRRLLTIDLARSVGINSDEVRRLISSKSPLSAVMLVNGPWVVSKQRWMALQPCIKELGALSALNFLGEAIRRLRPRLGRASQRERNSTSMLVGALMVYSTLSELFPGHDLESWYEALAPTFGSWSARYWEQRAIMCRTTGRTQPALLSRAESFALRAVGTVRDTYSLTTLGTVLLTKAELGAKEDVSNYYDRAFDSFQEASEEDPGNLVTWLAFLRYALRVAIRVTNQSETYDPDLVERLHDDWLRIHASTTLVAGPDEATKQELIGLRSQYDSSVGT